MKSKKGRSASVILRPRRGIVSCEPPADQVANALITIQERGLLNSNVEQPDEMRSSIVLKKSNPLHCTALEILERFPTMHRAEAIRFAMFLAAFQNSEEGERTEGFVSQVGDCEKAGPPVDQPQETKDIAKEEKKSVKIDPNIKSLRGLL